MSLPFLLEIGVEEIPDWMLVPALNQLQDAFQTLLDQQALGGHVTAVNATPRRLVLQAEGLLESQADTEELLLGPPKSAGAGAAGGFAKKMGTTVDQLGVETTAKGEYFSFKKHTKGQATAAILGKELPGLILRIPWPKTMYWNGKGTERFIRPIRWLAALLDTNVVPFEIAGVKTGNTTAGHRLLGKASIPVTIADFDDQLRANSVILCAGERQHKIETEIQALLESRGLHLQRDPDLLHTLVYITEFPTVILGEFDKQYLELPREVLVTVMKHHQKYFSVMDASGSLAPNFIAVMNTSADPEGLVRQGNERVLRARFNDARFFWETDLKRTLAERLEDLKHVTFQAKVGSYHDKTLRIESIARQLGDGGACKAAMISKCDLTTGMVKEFTDLQGIMGGLYAKQEGEPEEVWRAIYEHYKPVSMEDSIPSTISGRVLSVADRWDTLEECFRVGLVPTGSRDPFALRRAAQGLVKIVVEGEMDFPLRTQNAALEEFLRDRVETYFRDARGFKYDEVRACMSAGWQNLKDLSERLLRLQALRPTPDFEPIAASFKRIKNILKQADFTPGSAVKESLLEQGPETELFQAHRSTAGQTLEERIQALRPKIDLFFDKVLVNAPDEAIRTNRLTLLHNLLAEFSTIADFSEIVTEKGS
jgi:glycyl-tRNA synthetase beta chain